MHVSILELVDGSLVNARVDDELWQNARVPLGDLPAAERTWLARVATRAIASLVALEPRDADPESASGVRFESDGVRARVRIHGDTRDVALDPHALAELAMFLEAVQGALLIDEDSRGLNKRSGGDSPA